MPTSLQALEFCEQNQIAVFDTALPLNRSLSGRLGGDSFIIIDDRAMTEREKKTHLWHEIGHCATGAFYDPYTPLATRSRCEYRANSWAVRKLLPKARLERAMQDGAVEIWQLAEHFNVDERLVRFALQYYFNKGL